jgi:predicted HicB family RNase H-like nuclease
VLGYSCKWVTAGGLGMADEESDPGSSSSSAEEEGEDEEVASDTDDAASTDQPESTGALAGLILGTMTEVEHDKVDWTGAQPAGEKKETKRKTVEKTTKKAAATTEKRQKVSNTQQRVSPKIHAQIAVDQMALKQAISLVAGFLQPNKMMLAQDENARAALLDEQRRKFKSMLVTFSPWKYNDEEACCAMLQQSDPELCAKYQTHDKSAMLSVEAGFGVGACFEELSTSVVETNMVVMLLFEKLYELQQRHTGQMYKQSVTEKIEEWYTTIEGGLISERTGMSCVYSGTVHEMGAPRSTVSYGFENSFDDAFSSSVVGSVVSFVMEYFRPSYKGCNRVSYKWLAKYEGDEVSHYNKNPTMQTQALHDRAQRLLKIFKNK